MPTKKQASVNFDGSSSPVPARSGMSVMTGEVLTTPGQDSKRQQQHISDQVRNGQMMERGMAIKIHEAIYQTQHIAMSTDQRYDEFLTFQRSLLDKKGRNEQDQADFEAFTRTSRQKHGENLQGIRDGASYVIGHVALLPIDPPPDEPQEEIYIDRAPGFWGRLRGDIQVTRVRRR